MVTLFSDNWSEWIRLFAMAMIALPFLVIVKRLGKQKPGKLDAFDVGLGFIYGSVLSYLLLVPSIAFSTAVSLLFLLTLLQFLNVKFVGKPMTVSEFIRKDPACIYLDGNFNELLMKRERISLADVQNAVRSKGFDSLRQVGAVLVQNDGTLFVIAKQVMTPRKTPK